MNRSMLILSLLEFYEVCQKKDCNEHCFIDLKNAELVKIAKKILKENSKMEMTNLEQKTIDSIRRNIKRNKKHKKHKNITDNKLF